LTIVLTRCKISIRIAEVPIINADTLQQLKSLYAEAFDDSTEAREFFFARGFCAERCACIEENGRVVSALYWLPRTLCVSGKRLKCGLIAAVATLKSERCKGYAARAMNAALVRMRAAGLEIAVLYPDIKGYYERFGFVQITNKKFPSADGALSKQPGGLFAAKPWRPEADGAVELNSAPAPTLLSLYNRRMAGADVYFERTIEDMRYKIDECLADGGEVYPVMRGDEPVGYFMKCAEIEEACIPEQSELDNISQSGLVPCSLLPAACGHMFRLLDTGITDARKIAELTKKTFAGKKILILDRY